MGQLVHDSTSHAAQGEQFSSTPPAKHKIARQGPERLFALPAGRNWPKIRHHSHQSYPMHTAACQAPQPPWPGVEGSFLTAGFFVSQGEVELQQRTNSPCRSSGHATQPALGSKQAPLFPPPPPPSIHLQAAAAWWRCSRPPT